MRYTLANLPEMQPLGLISGGHTATVRCVNWNDEVTVHGCVLLLYSAMRGMQV